MLKSARDAKIPIVHITGLDDCGVEGWSARRSATVGEQSDEARDRRKRRYDIIDEVAPLPGEAVLRKSSPSAFWGTPLVGHLTSLGVDTIITCGESTSGCVRASVVDAYSNGIHTTIAEECTFDRSELSHKVNLFDMHHKYADVMHVDDIVIHLYRSAGLKEAV